MEYNFLPFSYYFDCKKTLKFKILDTKLVHKFTLINTEGLSTNFCVLTKFFLFTFENSTTKFHLYFMEYNCLSFSSYLDCKKTLKFKILDTKIVHKLTFINILGLGRNFCVLIKSFFSTFENSTTKFHQ